MSEVDYKSLFEKSQNENLRLKKEHRNMRKKCAAKEKQVKSLQIRNQELEGDLAREKELVVKFKRELTDEKDIVTKLKEELNAIGFSKLTFHIKTLTENHPNSKFHPHELENPNESVILAYFGHKSKSDVTEIVKSKLSQGEYVVATTTYQGDPSPGISKHLKIAYVKTEQIPRLHPEISLD